MVVGGGFNYFISNGIYMEEMCLVDEVEDLV